MDPQTYLQLGVALGLGLLVGMQRERTDSAIAGVRTFALIAVLGALCGLFAPSVGGWIVAAGLVGIAAFMVAGNIAKLFKRHADIGVTTEVAALVMFTVGALVTTGQTALGVVIGGTVAVLLQWKRPLHDLARRIGEPDAHAIAQFILITLVILPILPNHVIGPLDVFNPFKIWLMVVLVVGMSLAAYVAQKLLGPRGGTLVGGVFGGIISSTATTVSSARQAAQHPATAPLGAVVIAIASTVVVARLLIEIAAVTPQSLPVMGPPLLAMMIAMALIAAVAFFTTRADHRAITHQSDPANLRAALFFGLVYTLVLFAVAAVKQYYGPNALYAVAALSGLTDMDAITLSVSQLVRDNQLPPATGWRLILVAHMSNLVFKSALIAVIARRALFFRAAALLALSLAAGALLLILWPAS